MYKILPPKKEQFHKAKLDETRKKLKELREGLDRIKGLVFVHARRKELVVDVETMRHIRSINRWGINQ